MMKKLSISGYLAAFNAFSNKIDSLLKGENLPLNESLSFKETESLLVKSASRKAALEAFLPPLIKKAFDYRRTNQDIERNPRANLQYWSRSQEFLDDELFNKIETFSKLLTPLQEIKEKFEGHPEYFQSYARILLETVQRTVKISQGEANFFRPQIKYLEQLLFSRYRLSLDDIKKSSNKELYQKILKKDENMTKIGYMFDKQNTHTLMKDSNNSILDSILSSKNLLHKDGKSIERTIVITIKDNIIN